MTTTTERALMQRLDEMSAEIADLKSQTPISWITKNTTGLPSYGASGMFLENTVDNTLHAYYHGGWKQIDP